MWDYQYIICPYITLNYKRVQSKSRFLLGRLFILDLQMSKSKISGIVVFCVLCKNVLSGFFCLYPCVMPANDIHILSSRLSCGYFLV